MTIKTTKVHVQEDHYHLLMSVTQALLKARGAPLTLTMDELETTDELPDVTLDFNADGSVTAGFAGDDE